MAHTWLMSFDRKEIEHGRCSAADRASRRSKAGATRRPEVMIAAIVVLVALFATVALRLAT